MGAGCQFSYTFMLRITCKKGEGVLIACNIAELDAGSISTIITFLLSR